MTSLGFVDLRAEDLGQTHKWEDLSLLQVAFLDAKKDPTYYEWYRKDGRFVSKRRDTGSGQVPAESGKQTLTARATRVRTWVLDRRRGFINASGNARNHDRRTLLAKAFLRTCVVYPPPHPSTGRPRCCL